MNRVHLLCVICGAAFSVRPYRATTAKTCSATCRQKYNAKQQTGDAMRGKGEGKSYAKLKGRHAHRVIAEIKIGRPLLRGEIVHHIDGNRRNNAPENLEVLSSQREHALRHRAEGLFVRKATAKTCKICGDKYSAKDLCRKHYMEKYVGSKRLSAASV